SLVYGASVDIVSAGKLGGGQIRSFTLSYNKCPVEVMNGLMKCFHSCLVVYLVFILSA
ncbi:hypothetical protein ScPMuIL_005090, partial [Solemya velum]